MQNIYSVSPDKTLLIYPASHFLYFRTLNAKNAGRPVLLSTDYLTSLSDTIYQNTIYYGYINTEHNILIKNITEQTVLYTLNRETTQEFYSPQLFTIQNTLLLLYFLKNPLNDTFLLKGIFPFTQKEMTFLENFSELPTLHVISNTNLLLLWISTSYQNGYYLLDSASVLKPLSDENKIQKLTDSFQQKLTEADTTILTLRQQITEQNQLIESIKSQYNELMDTAHQYRNEAIKWRENYYARRKK